MTLGINPKNESEMKKAESADLITLPRYSKDDITGKKKCNHPKIDMYVSARMFYAFGTIKPLKDRGQS